MNEDVDQIHNIIFQFKPDRFKQIIKKKKIGNNIFKYKHSVHE